MSGGVDSAVSAGMLKQQGYEVTGVFIKAWTPSFANDGVDSRYPCTWKEDRRSAMRACAVLDIPFVTLDLEEEYKKGVVDYMVKEYKVGKTPNPDVMCNKEIKFGAFLKWALAQGVDFVATGHYARIGFASPESRRSRDDSPDEVLMEGKDKNKDQSYFLWTLMGEQLKHILFPVGGLEKSEVRKLAEKFGLPQATRKDSQGLCFLGQVDMKEFLRHYIEPKRGDVLNEAGETIGYHDGALFFTLGERHGFTVTHKSYSANPLYVVGKDTDKNTITVANKLTNITTHQKCQRPSLTLTEVNLLYNLPLECEARFRYRQDRLKCEVKKEGNEIIVEFENLSETPASGQSVVFYQGEVCLGGGIIK